MESGISKIKNISPKDIVFSLGIFWMKKFHLILILFFLLALGLGGYLWYRYMYYPGWNKDEKAAYTATNYAGKNLQEERLKDVIRIAEENKKRFQEDQKKHPDIFRSYNNKR